MTTSFQFLKERPQVSVTVTRDSVCAGDDGDAPHEITREVYSYLDPVALVRELSSGYLPSVAGVGHSWTCVMNGDKIAEVSSSGEVRSIARESVFADENRVHFVYHSARF
jgi:hypothetical protein